ncbi:polysaccharide pyruvyl transferase family protein [Paenibacillus chartarius]|uniref:Polysaccharide pyruvyl transferase family protein n=1 Tax=Paenibacillus chartarius TaxID=747481 RepID=A0ABV6DRK2_9BACL
MNLCVCGYYGFGNFGDELFLRTLAQQFPEDAVFPYSPLVDIAQVDAVIIGGGDLITPYHYNNYYFPEALRGLPTWVYGVGIVDFYPENTWPAAAVNRYRERLQETNGLYLRDEWSVQTARSHSFHSAVELVPDIAFSYKEPRYPFRFSASKKTVGVCVFAYDDFPFDSFVKLLGEISRQNLALVLIPVVHHVNNPYTDLAVCARIRDAVKDAHPAADIVVAEAATDLDITYRCLQSVDYLISFKLHPALVALRGGVPVLSLSKMGKVRSLLRSLGLSAYFADYEAPHSVLADRVEMLLSQGKADVDRVLPLIRDKETTGTAKLQSLREQIRAVCGR